jgi:glycosyltransferase involved in cell wall biosynthesis
MAKVSIVIPTYNRLARLKQVIAAIERQTYPQRDIEVIIVSDGSTDGTDEYLSAIKAPLSLRFMPQANAGPAAARNKGIRNAQGDIVLFIDDDVVPNPELVTEHARMHENHPNLVVLGPMLNPPDFTFSPWVAWEQAMLEKQYVAMRQGKWEATARQFYTGNTSLLRQVLLNSGGFDERFRRAEDIELAYRLEQQGVEFTFTMAAEAYHYAERSFTSWLQTPYIYGRHDIIFSREHHKDILSFVHEGYRQRNPLTHLSVSLCLDRPCLSDVVQFGAKWIADMSYKAGKFGGQISQAAYSAIFNLRYYQGVADELGGRKIFFGGAKAGGVGNALSS